MIALLRHPLVLLGIAVTAVVSVLPATAISHYTPSLRIALETAAALAAMTAAFVVFGRVRQGGNLNQVALALALTVLAVASVVTGVFVAFTGAPRSLLVAAIAIRLVGAWTLAAAAFLPPLVLERRGRVAFRFAAAAVPLVCLITAIFLFWAWDVRDVVLDRLADAGQPDPDRMTVIAVFQALTAAGFVAAAVGFARGAERTGDHFLRWIAVGSVLAALARVQFILVPSPGKYWLHSGDVFVLAFYLVLLFAAAHEVRGYWRGLAETAVLEERRRIARELHDGVAQELAYIARRARRAGPGDPVLGQIAAAAERALNDSRRAIAALTRPLDEPFDRALAQAAEEVAQRTGASLELELEEGVRLSAPTREALLRIACEAVTNAARHAGVDTVRLELRNGDGVLLRISDEGSGFDPAAPRPGANGGFGLVAMRERAAAVGADFRVESAPGAGTTVEVELR